MPYAIFKKAIEPILLVMFENYIYPVYELTLEKCPASAYLFNLIFGIAAKLIGYSTEIVNWLSGKTYHDMSGAENHY